MQDIPARSRPRGLGVYRLFYGLLALVALYAVLAYVVLPELWEHHENQPGLAGRPMVTKNADGIPGDALNVGLVGNVAEIVKALVAAGWRPADRTTLASSIEIIGSVLLRLPDQTAPVSNLFYEGRRQDLAFEQQDGRSADRRHHVRFWRVLDHGLEGRPVWLGAATFDRGVGVSRYTGQVTHHIAPDIDAERDLLIADVTQARMLIRIYQVSGIGPTLAARNASGDLYRTDGEITFGVVSPDAIPQTVVPVMLPNPGAVALKDVLWKQAGNFAAMLTPE